MIKSRKGGPNLMKRRFAIWWMYEGSGLYYRDCNNDSCSAMRVAIYSEVAFPILFRHYLRERHLGEKSIEDYFILFSLYFHFHILSLHQCGIAWRELENGEFWRTFDQMTLPQTTRVDFTQAYVDALLQNVTEVVTNAGMYLQHDPFD